MVEEVVDRPVERLQLAAGGRRLDRGDAVAAVEQGAVRRGQERDRAVEALARGGALARRQLAAERLDEEGDALAEHLLARRNVEDLVRPLLVRRTDTLQRVGPARQRGQQQQRDGGAAADGDKRKGAHAGSATGHGGLVAS